jgi:hypothetical protein
MGHRAWGMGYGFFMAFFTCSDLFPWGTHFSTTSELRSRSRVFIKKVKKPETGKTCSQQKKPRTEKPGFLKKPGFWARNRVSSPAVLTQKPSLQDKKPGSFDCVSPETVSNLTIYLVSVNLA